LLDLGRPGDRNVDSNPCRFAVVCCQGKEKVTAEEKVTAATDIRRLCQAIIAATTDVRRKMTQKYQMEF
jgi:hypothetical protein